MQFVDQCPCVAPRRESTRESSCFVIRREKHGQQVAEKRRLALLARQGTNDIMRPAKCAQPFGQLARHLFNRLGGPSSELS